MGWLKKILASLRKYKHRRMVNGAIRNGLNLGKNVTIMDNVRFDPPHNSLISIGDNTTIGPEVAFIAHDATTFKPINHGRIGFIDIGSNCFIGERSIILPGAKIGPHCIVGAGSVVAHDIPQGSVAAGNPCKVVKSYTDFIENNKNLIKAGVSVEYGELYGSIKENVEQLRRDHPDMRIFFSRGQTGNKLKSHFRFNAEDA